MTRRWRFVFDVALLLHHTAKKNEGTRQYVVTVKPQGRMWLISSSCTSTPQLQMIAVISDWVLVKHESKQVINPPRWGQYLSYGMVRTNLPAVSWRAQCSSAASIPLCWSYSITVYSMYYVITPPTCLNRLDISKRPFSASQSSMRSDSAQDE